MDVCTSSKWFCLKRLKINNYALHRTDHLTICLVITVSGGPAPGWILVWDFLYSADIPLSCFLYRYRLNFQHIYISNIKVFNTPLSAKDINPRLMTSGVDKNCSKSFRIYISIILPSVMFEFDLTGINEL